MKKTDEPTDKKLKEQVENARQAIESFVCLNMIATGILTLIAFTHSREIWERYSGWIQTLRSNIPTIATVKTTLLRDFHAILPQICHLPSFAFIKPLVRCVDFLYQDVA